MDWIDAAKGIGILLVVVGHAIGGLIDAGIRPAVDWFRPAMLAIYVFHMQFFFFLSGLFVPHRLEQGSAAVGRRALTGIVWPYLLWGSLQILAIHTAAAYVNAPIADLGATLLGMFWSAPPSQFWFLYVLFLAQMAALALLPMVGAAGMLAMALLFAAFAPHPLPVVLSFSAAMLPYFALGCLAGARDWTAVLGGFGARRAMLLALLAMVVVGGIAAMLVDSVGADAFRSYRANAVAGLAWRPEAAMAALSGIIGTLALAAWTSGPLRSVLAFLGRRSMTIFLLHVLAIAGTRIFLVRVVGWSDPSMVFVLIAVGAAAPLAAGWMARRLGLARILAL